MKTKKRKISIFIVIIYIVLSLFTLCALYPFIYTLAGSFSDGEDYSYGGVWLFPRVFTWANYKIVLEDTRLYVSVLNTLIITVVGTILALIITSCVAYAMSQRELKGKTFFRAANLITLFFSGGMVPYYLIIVVLGLYDNFLVYIIPSVYSVYNMIILSSFFRGIDGELREAAIVDGASEIRIWATIFLPLSKPALATVGLWVAVARWNAYLPTLLYTSKSENMWTLQYYLMRIIRDSQMPPGEGVYGDQVSQKTISFAAIIVSIVPILCIYPVISKFFTKGVMVGSLKG